MEDEDELHEVDEAVAVGVVDTKQVGLDPGDVLPREHLRVLTKCASEAH